MRVLLSLALCAVFCSLSVAGEYPEKNIRMIVPYPAGGTTDILARAIQQPTSTLLGQPIIIENKGGGGGTIGTEAAAQPA
jgi:tripartite-type tricarboxylate transporter receptor subunit TctC